jgi:Flp pilus assembly protein TadD
MRWQGFQLLLFVGLCGAGLSGCANLKGADDDAPLGTLSPREAASASPNSVPNSRTGLLTGAPSGRNVALSEQEQNLLEGQFAMARLCERRGESEQAEQIYNALLQKVPQDARLHHRLGAMAMKKGDFVQAEERLRMARTLAPPTAELLSDIGYCCYLQQELPEAEEALKEALNLEPTCATAVNNLALVMGREGRFQESLDLFKRTNTEAEAYANLAYVLAQNGETAQAKSMYLRALTLDNTMRVAAQAMLQIEEREQVQAKLTSGRPEPPSVASPQQAAQPTECQDQARRTNDSYVIGATPCR